MTAAFSYRHQGRSGRLIAILIGVYAVTAFLVITYDIVWWIAVLPVLVTLPSLWELATNPQSGLDVSGDRLSWFVGDNQQAIRLTEIDHVRFQTRWDFSVAVFVVRHEGRRQPIPLACLPPHRDLEKALQRANVTTSRHHFTRK